MIYVDSALAEIIDRTKRIEDQIARELTARTRRIETRLTAYLVSQGTEVGTPPRWVDTPDGGYIEITATTSSLMACMALIPPGCDYEVDVVHDGVIVAVLSV